MMIVKSWRMMIGAGGLSGWAVAVTGGSLYVLPIHGWLNPDSSCWFVMVNGFTMVNNESGSTYH